MFLKFLQNSQESTCARVTFLIKFQAPPATLLKRRLWYRSFPVNFAKFLGTPFYRTPPGDCFWMPGPVTQIVIKLGYQKQIDSDTCWNSAYLIGKKKVGKKWLNFGQMTKFFTDQIFSRLFFLLTEYFHRLFFYQLAISTDFLNYFFTLNF